MSPRWPWVCSGRDGPTLHFHFAHLCLVGRSTGPTRDFGRRELQICTASCEHLLLLRWAGAHFISGPSGHGLCLNFLLPAFCIGCFDQREGHHERCTFGLADSVRSPLGSIAHGLLHRAPRVPCIFDWRLQETPGSHLDHRRGLSCLHGFVWGHGLFLALRSGRILGTSHCFRGS